MDRPSRRAEIRGDGVHHPLTTGLILSEGRKLAAVALVIVSGSFAGTAAVTAVVAYALASPCATLDCALLFARMTEPAG
jgi:hypothetical protein